MPDAGERGAQLFIYKIINNDNCQVPVLDFIL